MNTGSTVQLHELKKFKNPVYKKFTAIHPNFTSQANNRLKDWQCHLLYYAARLGRVHCNENVIHIYSSIYAIIFKTDSESGRSSFFTHSKGTEFCNRL